MAAGDDIKLSYIKATLSEGTVFGTGVDHDVPGLSFSLNTGLSETTQVTCGCYDYLDIITSNEGTITLDFEP
jgi:hypothetical protein